MRLKTFNAPTMAEAMAEVRAVLGNDALIVSTYESRRGRGISVTAALDQAAEDARIEAAAHDARPPQRDRVAEALAWHGVPDPLAEALCRYAAARDAETPELALAGALDQRFSFAHLADGRARPVLIVGTPGAGKTMTAARLAARALMDGHEPYLISTDTVRAGAIEQLAALAAVMETAVHRADGAAALRQALAAAPEGAAIFVDTPGTNPLSGAELDDIARLADAAPCETVQVLGAGSDPSEAADNAAAFARLGAASLHVTRIDAARRLGSVLAAADAAALTLCDVSVDPFVGEALNPINPVSLARLLLRDPDSGPVAADLEGLAQCL